MVYMNQKRQFRFCGLLIDTRRGFLANAWQLLLAAIFWGLVLALLFLALRVGALTLFDAIDRHLANESAKTARYLADNVELWQ